MALIAIALIAILCAGYAYYWHYVAARLATGIAEWAAQQRTLGNQVAFENDPIAGFPFAFRTSFHGVALGFQQPSGILTVTGETLLAEMRPWNLQDIAVTSDTPVGFALQSPDMTQQARLESGKAGIQLQSSGQLTSVMLDGTGASVTVGAGTYTAEKVIATIELPAALPADYHQPLLSFDVALDVLHLPSGQKALTDAPIEKAAAKGAIMGPVPSAGNVQDMIRGWANAGGIVDLKSFDFAQAPLRLAGEGTVTLDEALQPLGALTIRAQGLPEAIDLLARDGLIDAQAAKTGGMMAKGLAKPDAEGHPTVSVSLSLQQGYLWLGPIKLTRLPAVAW